MVAQVLVEITAKAVDKLFDYNVPLALKDSIAIGKRVLVPFGSKKLEGFVINISKTSSFDGKLKDVIEVIDEETILTDELIEIGNYISKKSLATKMASYQAMLPKALKAKNGVKIKEKYETYLKLVDPSYVGANTKQKELLAMLADKTILKKELKDYASPIKTLLQKGVIKEEYQEVYRLNYALKQDEQLVTLNKEQKQAVTKVIASKDTFHPFLLYGVTGSGKTEVYMRIIADTLKRGKDAIILVPEISLTPQLVSQFERRFGSDIAVLHSRLSDAERYDEWRKIVRGEVHIAIGARSAIFAPFKNLGIIILDEEHTKTYKQETNPRYYAVDIAIFRAKYHHIPVLFGSATPSLESFTRAKMGIYELLRLTKRINNNLPEVSLIDMADEIKHGHPIISKPLLQALNTILEKKEQAIILLNRRGYATTVLCHECGYKVMCPNCEIPLTYHKKTNTMRCHYCDYTTYKPKICPNCKSDKINQFGLGTERLEEELARLLPTARIIRMDIDTTSKKGSHSSILTAFKNYEYDILVGTQMIAKGLDFENVTLVGVVNGDASLNIPDFRSAERTFSLLDQVAGRAGRGDKLGQVIIQGFNLNHYSILKAKIHDYEGFYEEEMNVRKQLKYPPFYNLTMIQVIGKDYDECYKEATKITQYLRNNVSKIIVLGPSNAFISKVNNNYYIQITIKYKKSKELMEALTFINQKYVTPKLKVEIDINPL